MSGSYWKRRAQARLQQARDDARDAREQEQEQRTGGRSRAGVAGWRSLVEQRIQDGIEQGLFDNLPGAGKPLNLDEDALVPEDLRMAFRLLRSNGLAPLWVELNKEIRDDLARLERFRMHVRVHRQQINAIQLGHYRNDYIARVHEINAKILNYNILAPSPRVHFGSLILDDELEKFDSISSSQ